MQNNKSMLNSEAMKTPVKLLSKDRVLMFLNQYYFGPSKALTLIRLVTGPLMIYVGIKFLNTYREVAFAYFSIVYGSYLIVKPLVWILFRLNSFKTVEISLDVQDDFIVIKDEFSESKILFEGFEEISKKRWYYVLHVTKSNRMHLPFYLFTNDQRLMLDQNVTH
jgi:hypothetical protein